MIRKDKPEEYTWRHEREAIIEAFLECRTEMEFNNMLLTIVENVMRNLEDEE